MDFESKALGWFADLRGHFNTLCSEADALVPQEPIEFVRNQFITAGESLEQFCAEFLQESIGCLKKKSPDSPSHALLSKSGGDCIDSEIKKPEPSNTVEEVHCDDQVNQSSSVLSSVVMEETGQIGSLAKDHFSSEPNNEVTSSTEAIHSSGLSEGKGVLSSLVVECVVGCLMEYHEETRQIDNFAEDHFTPEPGDGKTPQEEVTSSTEAIHSCGLWEGKEVGCSCASELSGDIVFTRNLNGWQEVDESDDEFCLDFDMEKSNNHLLGAVSATEWEKVDDDQCGSDWEII